MTITFSLDVGKCSNCGGEVVAWESDNTDWGEDWAIIHSDDLNVECRGCGWRALGAEVLLKKETQDAG